VNSGVPEGFLFH